MHRLLVAKLRLPHLVAVDVVLALVLFPTVAYAAFDATTPSSPEEPAWVSITVTAVIVGAVAVRRLWPLCALAVCVGAEIAAMVTEVMPMVAMGAALNAIAIVLYLVASAEPKRRSVPALLAAVTAIGAGVVVSRLAHAPYEPWSETVFGLGFGSVILVTGWTIGLTARERRLYTERTAVQRAEQAVTEERLRIARDLHDIVAHSMSLIAVQAGIGNHVAEERPEEARKALRVIEATSRGSLTEMRHLLGVLRSDVDSPALAPAPDADGIAALVERARSAGVPVSLEVADLSALPDGIGLSVYRIVQEALTNVVRHAASARCWVRITAPAEEVLVEVTNDGPATEQRPGGHGLIGMRERVSVYGGTFEAGPRPCGGWRVSAALPLGVGA